MCWFPHKIFTDGGDLSQEKGLSPPTILTSAQFASRHVPFSLLSSN